MHSRAEGDSYVLFANGSQSLSHLKAHGLLSAAVFWVPGEETSFDKLCLRSVEG